MFLLPTLSPDLPVATDCAVIVSSCHIYVCEYWRVLNWFWLCVKLTKEELGVELNEKEEDKEGMNRQQMSLS